MACGVRCDPIRGDPGARGSEGVLRPADIAGSTGPWGRDDGWKPEPGGVGRCPGPRPRRAGRLVGLYQNMCSFQVVMAGLGKTGQEPVARETRVPTPCYARRSPSRAEDEGVRYGGFDGSSRTTTSLRE